MKKNYTPEFKAKVVLELFRGELSLGQLASEYEELTKDLYAQIGELTTKLAWLKKNLESTFSREQSLAMLENYEDFSMTRQCGMLSLNRTSLYYKPRPSCPSKLAVLHAIDEIFTEGPVYGARRIRNKLMKRGFSINRPTVKYMTILGLSAIWIGYT